MSDEDTEFMREIRAIRQKHYEETKHMTDAEHTEHILRKTAPVMARYGLKDSDRPLIKPVKPTPALAEPSIV